LRLLVFLFSTPVILFLGCAGGSPNLRQFFGSTTAEPPSEQAANTETATPSATSTPAQLSSQSHAHKKSGKDVHLAVEKASEASESAAEASAKAQQASKQARQAADAASRAETADTSSGKSVVSLEANPAPSSGSTPAAAINHRFVAVISSSIARQRPRIAKSLP